MKSVNYALRSAYVTALNALIVGDYLMPVYYQRLPDNVDDENYILITDLVNNDAGTINSSDTTSFIQLQIHTSFENGNSGKQADDAANAMFALVYPNQQFNLDLSAAGLQIVTTSVSNDQTLDQIDTGNKTFQTRVITFKHNIYHK